MYSFEGDYRRKPQQNLAGASRRDEKAALLQHAQLERLKREQERKRHDAAVKLQAVVRSFVVRQAFKRQERQEFDVAQQKVGTGKLGLNEIAPYLCKVLFFYDESHDSTRFIWLLQQLIKHHVEIKLQAISSMEWSWRLR